MSDYNGWTNYETWNLNLWIENDEGVYREKCREIRRAWREIEPEKVEFFAKTIFPNGTPDMDEGDLDKVNWAEIAEHWEAERLEMMEEA